MLWSGKEETVSIFDRHHIIHAGFTVPLFVSHLCLTTCYASNNRSRWKCKNFRCFGGTAIVRTTEKESNTPFGKVLFPATCNLQLLWTDKNVTFFAKNKERFYPFKVYLPASLCLCVSLFSSSAFNLVNLTQKHKCTKAILILTCQVTSFLPPPLMQICWTVTTWRVQPFSTKSGVSLFAFPKRPMKSN